MNLNPYLFFNGECEAALKFYEQNLGGKIKAMMRHEGSPMEKHVPAEWRPKILHAALTLGDQTLMASDAPPDKYQKPEGFYVAINLKAKETAEAERMFKVLSEAGSVQMPLQETFWAARFAMLTDRFGIPWMINCGDGA
jgi:PhnB protein